MYTGWGLIIVIYFYAFKTNYHEKSYISIASNVCMYIMVLINSNYQLENSSIALKIVAHLKS